MIIICTVTNDLTYDQRMQRICTSLAEQGYWVQLVGRQLPASIPLKSRPFEQKRLRCRFRKGFPFYAEYNLRLFFYLMTARYDAVCSVDLDTLGAGCLATLLRRKKRVFDAHEYFTEVPEVVHRPVVKAFWGLVAWCCLPFYRHAYTVGPALAEIFAKKYGLP
ncbi:MAG: glycosyltransferase, partial [Saprospiraceae bacterium]